MNRYNLTLTPASWHTISSPNHWGACSDHVRPVKAGLPGLETITALEVITMPGQTDAEAVFRALWLLGWSDPRTARYLAEKCARHVLPTFEAKYPDDKRPRKCLNTIRRWLAGKATDQELADAAAYAAAADAYAADAAAAYAAADADAAAYERKWQRTMITRELRKLAALEATDA